MVKKKPLGNVSVEDEEKEILEYMIKTNRPYSATDVFNNLHAKYSKPRIIKALDKLVDDKALMSKAYGKTFIYSKRQEVVENEEREQVFDAMSNEISQLSEELDLIKGENKRLDDELSKIKTEVTTTEAVVLIEQYKEEFKQIFSAVTENMPGNSNEFKQALGIEDDEIPFDSDPLSI